MIRRRRPPKLMNLGEVIGGLRKLRQDLTADRTQVTKIEDDIAHHYKRALAKPPRWSPATTARGGIDYSYWRPTVQQLHELHVGWVGRYYSRDDTKCLTAGEARALHAQQVAIVSIYEDAEDTLIVEPGTIAALATKDARNAGQPPGTGIYGAIDLETGPSRFIELHGAILKWKRIVESEGFVPGIYGGLYTCRLAHSLGIPLLFQTIAWSGGVWTGHNAIRQVENGQNYDRDIAEVQNFGQW